MIRFNQSSPQSPLSTISNSEKTLSMTAIVILHLSITGRRKGRRERAKAIQVKASEQQFAHTVKKALIDLVARMLIRRGR